MNVFILCTGRCGSTTFFEACRHATNYTAAHESRSGLVGASRLSYPPNHIEVDNRLSWFLGRLEKAYGDEAFYVHLRRDDLATARSFVRRYDRGIIKAYREGILLGIPEDAEPLGVCLDYCETVNANVELFLKDKTKKARVSLENAKEDFKNFWGLIGAEGDLRAALSEWDVAHNASGRASGRVKGGGSILARLAHKARKVVGSQRP
ncbi:MAG TPA: hypothetical protein VEQ42_02320 [Pyrinomonadaceae bacterium]|nr:hypothetical protein [Pyrinomonadaceae bacterium]